MNESYTIETMIDSKNAMEIILKSVDFYVLSGIIRTTKKPALVGWFLRRFMKNFRIHL